MVRRAGIEPALSRHTVSLNFNLNLYSTSIIPGHLPGDTFRRGACSTCDGLGLVAGQANVWQCVMVLRPYSRPHPQTGSGHAHRISERFDLLSASGSPRPDTLRPLENTPRSGPAAPSCPSPSGEGTSYAPNRYPSTASPVFLSGASSPFASSRANFTASCSFSTRPSSSLTRVAGSAPENFRVFQ